MEKESSFLAALEKTAQLLRQETKSVEKKGPLKKHRVKISSTTPSLHNAVEQMAKLLRSQVHEKERLKNRKKEWKKMGGNP